MAITALRELTLKADSVADAPRVLTETLEATRVFAGDQGVEVLNDVTGLTHVVVIERWTSMTAPVPLTALLPSRGTSRLRSPCCRQRTPLSSGGT